MRVNSPLQRHTVRLRGHQRHGPGARRAAGPFRMRHRWDQPPAAASAVSQPIPPPWKCHPERRRLRL